MATNSSNSNVKQNIDELNALAYRDRHTENEKSMEWAKEAYDLSIKNKYLLGQAQSLLNIGFLQLNKGEHNDAFSHFMEALFIFKDEQNDLGIADAQYNLGVLNFRLGNYELALTQINECLSLRKEAKAKDLLGKCYYQMAIIRFQLKDFEGAIKATEKSLKYEVIQDYSSGIAAVLNLQGRIYTEIEHFADAEQVLTESLDRRLALGENIGIASTLFYLMELWLKQGNYNKAKEQMTVYGGLFDEISFPFGQAQSEQLKARIEMHFHNNEKVEEYLNNSIRISEEFSLREQLSQAYLLYSKYYESIEEIKRALDFYKKYHDSSEENNKLQSEKMLHNINLTNDINNARKKAEILKLANYDLTLANQKISAMNLNLKSSIVYAKRIQESVFPTANLIREFFQNFLLIHRPKDIVSGDFLWMHQFKGVKFIAVADCTGHGVPGAMLSMYANNVLTNYNFSSNSKPAEILDFVRTHFIADLISETITLKDGMDIALIRVHDNELTFAGAYRPLYILREGELIELNGDRQPVGQFLRMRAFTNVIFQLKPGDQVMMFTDGINDQMGGERNKKLKINGFKEWILEICKKPIEIQQSLLQDKMDEWKGENEQTDDQMIFSFIVH